MVPNKRNYNEYNLDNILEMGYEAFGKMLEPEIYSLVLMFRLLELMENLENIEEYMYCHQIQCWFDINSIVFKREDI
jgi:hypothetical protein